MKNWLECVPLEYKDAELKNCDKLPSGYREFGRKWAKSWPLKSLYIHGVYGSGKTYWAFAIIREVIKEFPEQDHLPWWPYYISGSSLDSKLLAAIKSDIGDQYEIDQWGKHDLVFIDDIDKIRDPKPRIMTQIFEILYRRYSNNLPTIITSNSASEELTSILDGALISRMRNESKWTHLVFPERDLRQKKVISFT